VSVTHDDAADGDEGSSASSSSWPRCAAGLVLLNMRQTTQSAAAPWQLTCIDPSFHHHHENSN
jgi:hypothetical protein